MFAPFQAVLTPVASDPGFRVRSEGGVALAWEERGVALAGGFEGSVRF